MVFFQWAGSKQGPWRKNKLDESSFTVESLNIIGCQVWLPRSVIQWHEFPKCLGWYRQRYWHQHVIQSIMPDNVQHYMTSLLYCKGTFAPERRAKYNCSLRNSDKWKYLVKTLLHRQFLAVPFDNIFHVARAVYVALHINRFLLLLRISNFEIQVTMTKTQFNCFLVIVTFSFTGNLLAGRY